MKNVTFIRAGAGSGKTHRVTELVEQAIRNHECRVGGLIATTFTKKAAAELRERVRTKLYSAGLPAAAEQLGQSLIGTVHSVAERLLRRFAFEAEISPRLEILDEDAAQLLLQQALDSVSTFEEIRQLQELASRLNQQDPQTKDFQWRAQVMRILEALRTNAFRPEDMAAAAEASSAELLGYFGQPLEPFDEAGLRQLIESAMTAVSEWGDATNKTSDYLETLKGFVGELGQADQAWTKWIELSTVEPGKRKIPEPVKQLVEAVQQRAAEYRRHPRLHADIQNYTAQLFGLAARSLASFQQLKESRGLVDFNDLECRAWHLLRSSAEVRAQLAESLDLLVVDEFQDTSPLQLALFTELARCARRVVWVGDVKQAIYGFRNSDPELIDAVVAELAQHGGLGEPLSASYRSVPALVQFVNAHFTQPFADSLKLGAAEVQLAAQRAPLQADLPAVECWELSRGDGGGRFTNAQADAALAEAVVQLLRRQPPVRVLPKGEKSERNLRAGDIAILCRRNSRAASLAETLGKRGVPTSLGGPGLLATPEARLALACLRRLADFKDTLATAEVIALSGNLVPEDWLTDRLASVAALAEGKPDRWGVEGKLIEPRLLALETAARILPTATVTELLDAALEQADVFAVVTAWGPDEARANQRRANLESLRTLAIRYETAAQTTHAPTTLGGFLVWCDELAAGEGDTQAAGLGTDAVAVLTYHAAKGLEWPVVICAELDTGSEPRLFEVKVTTANGAKLSLENPLAGRQVRFWASPFGKKKANLALLDELHNSPAGQAAARRLRSEELRLLYVGLTRARDRLILALKEASENPWLDQIAPGGLRWKEEQLELPDGQLLSASRLKFEPPAEAGLVTSTKLQRSWFPAPVEKTPRLAARIVPSGNEPVTGCVIGRTVDWGQRLPLQGRPDEARLGDALHAVFAASFSRTDWEHAIPQILARHEMQSHLPSTDAIAAVKRFYGWIAEMFQPRTCLVETPFYYRNEAGQLVTGFIDLLLETPGGWVIIDHKSFPGGRTGWEAKALTFSGQLALYAAAVSRTKGPVMGTWIHFAVAGGMVEVGFPLRP